jgi:hypothetical protein
MAARLIVGGRIMTAAVDGSSAAMRVRKNPTITPGRLHQAHAFALTPSSAIGSHRQWAQKNPALSERGFRFNGVSD